MRNRVLVLAIYISISIIELILVPLPAIQQLQPVQVQEQPQIQIPKIDYDALDIAFKTGEEIVTLRKFKHQSHTISTADGFLLHTMRIINPLIDKPFKGPVLFVHGVLLSMTSFLINSRGMEPRRYNSRCPLKDKSIKDINDYRSLPLMLSNSGYDVWMLNVRGVGLSSHSMNMSIDKDSFWAYNLDKLASHDLPSAVYYIKNITGSPTIGYISHSQGTFLLFAALIQFAELNKIIKPAVAMAPIAYLDNLTGLSKHFAFYEHIMFKTNNEKDRCAISPNLRQFIFDTCKSDPRLCNQIQTITNGQSDMDAYPVGYASHLGFPTASRNINHYYQLVHYTHFSRYDFGPEANLKHYGQSRPPNYNPERITNKYLVFVVGQTDLLSTTTDARRLQSELIVPLYREMYLSGNANHMDMLVSESCGLRVNKPLLEMFESLSGC